MRRLLPLIVLPLVSLAVAAPVPKGTDEEKWKRVLGEVVDPEKDCKGTFAADSFSLDRP